MLLSHLPLINEVRMTSRRELRNALGSETLTHIHVYSHTYESTLFWTVRPTHICTHTQISVGVPIPTTWAGTGVVLKARPVLGVAQEVPQTGGSRKTGTKNYETAHSGAAPSGEGRALAGRGRSGGGRVSGMGRTAATLESAAGQHHTSCLPPHPTVTSDTAPALRMHGAAWQNMRMDMRMDSGVVQL